MADRLVKVVGKHVKGCFALKNAGTGFWNTQWGPISYGKHGEPIVTTERRYGKRGIAYRHWVRFICNNTACKAELHVEADFILEAAKRATKNARHNHVLKNNSTKEK